MPQLSMYTGTALSYLVNILDGLVVFEQNMQKNLFLHKDMVMSEWLLFQLAPVMGKMEAQEKLHTLLRKVAEDNSSLREILAEDQEISPLLNDEDMESLDHPERYIGQSVQLVDDTLAEITALRQNDPEVLCT
jgi:3-carboxy-cis,cis-muconate cycloisomerase